MDELTNHLNYIGLLLFIYTSIVIITYIVYKFVKSSRWIKYLPGLFSCLIGIYGLFRLFIDDFWTKGMDNILITTTGISAGLISLLFISILKIYNSGKTKKAK